MGRDQLADEQSDLVRAELMSLSRSDYLRAVSDLIGVMSRGGPAATDGETAVLLVQTLSLTDAAVSGADVVNEAVSLVDRWDEADGAHTQDLADFEVVAAFLARDLVDESKRFAAPWLADLALYRDENPFRSGEKLLPLFVARLAGGNG